MLTDVEPRQSFVLVYLWALHLPCEHWIGMFGYVKKQLYTCYFQESNS